MSEIVTVRVNEELRARLTTFARRRGFVHPSQRPNVSAATRELLTQGLRAVEAETAGAHAKASES